MRKLQRKVAVFCGGNQIWWKIKKPENFEGFFHIFLWTKKKEKENEWKIKNENDSRGFLI